MQRRRHNPDELPGWRELVESSGYGWLLELVQLVLAAAGLALLGLVLWFAWHVSMTNLRQTIQQTDAQSSQVTPAPNP